MGGLGLVRMCERDTNRYKERHTLHIYTYARIHAPAMSARSLSSHFFTSCAVCVCVCVRERERDHELVRERQRCKETGRQKDREAERQTCDMSLSPMRFHHLDLVRCLVPQTFH